VLNTYTIVRREFTIMRRPQALLSVVWDTCGIPSVLPKVVVLVIIIVIIDTAVASQASALISQPWSTNSSVTQWTLNELYPVLWPENIIPLLPKGRMQWKLEEYANENLNNYPIDTAAFDRSYTSPKACQFERFQHVFKAAEEGKCITIAVLGGSMTFGKDIDRDQCTKPCAWAAKFGHWLRAYIPQWRVEVKNMALLGHGAGR
jgi:hypothetical protein